MDEIPTKTAYSEVTLYETSHLIVLLQNGIFAHPREPTLESDPDESIV
jgi:hypothetical protein